MEIATPSRSPLAVATHATMLEVWCPPHLKRSDATKSLVRAGGIPEGIRIYWKLFFDILGKLESSFWWVLVGFSLREEVLPGGSPPGRISSREDPRRDA